MADRSPGTKLFFARTINKVNLGQVLDTNSFRIFNQTQKFGYNPTPVPYSADRELMIQQFSAPPGATPVYPFTGNWSDLETKLGERFKAHSYADLGIPDTPISTLLIVGEIPSQIVNLGRAPLYLNVAFLHLDLGPRGQAVAKVLFEEGKLTVDEKEASHLLPELQSRIDFAAKKPFFKSKDGWYAEGYFMDPGDLIKLTTLPEVRIYKETYSGVERLCTINEGRVTLETEGKPNNPEVG